MSLVQVHCEPKLACHSFYKPPSFVAIVSIARIVKWFSCRQQLLGPSSLFVQRVWVVTDRLRQLAQAKGRNTAAAVSDTTDGAAEATEEFDEEKSHVASLALLDKMMLQLMKQTAFLSQIVFLQLAGRQQDRTGMSVVMTLCATVGIMLQMGLEYWTHEVSRCFHSRV